MNRHEQLLHNYITIHINTLSYQYSIDDLPDIIMCWSYLLPIQYHIVHVVVARGRVTELTNPTTGKYQIMLTGETSDSFSNSTIIIAHHFDTLKINATIE